ncbi:MAG: tRNA modification GTPase trmE [Acidobacteria bacterium]|nr:tRNA modification GTPase trmE [Acidobacteriota bacterium]
MADRGDTICALSSAPGRSGIAVVRVSGPQCFEIVGRVFTPSSSGVAPDRQAALGRVFDMRSGAELDQALVTRFASPNSYTGEDVAELSVHGSPVVVSHLLDSLCAAGARLAEPGEFTLRAFLNGRMDLVQAEAVRDVIEAQTFYQLQVAGRQLAGALSLQLEPVRRELVELIAGFETAVEFVEEDLNPESRERVAARLDKVLAELSRWTRSFRRGRIVREGFSLAVAGRPNVGKSSLFNALLAEERSIVTELPGTTRDLVSESAGIEGVPVRLTDTAGLRDGGNPIERIGVDRSIRLLSDVDAILLVLDTSRAYCGEDQNLLERMRGYSCIVAFNKCDLPCAWTAEDKAEFAGKWQCEEVSALTGENVDRLRAAIRRHLFGEDAFERDGLLVTQLRHSQCLESARAALEAAAGALRGGESEEFVLADLYRGLRKLGEITGETGVEEILGAVFSRFCIGK